MRPVSFLFFSTSPAVSCGEPGFSYEGYRGLKTITHLLWSYTLALVHLLPLSHLPRLLLLDFEVQRSEPRVMPGRSMR